MTAVVAATLVIASLVTPSLPVNLDPTIMAHIALGEAGGWGIWGDRAWEIRAMVIWVARNQAARSQEGYDPRSQFYAWEEDITQADIDRAAAVLAAPWQVNPVPKMLHVISEQDRVRLGFPRGDIVECGVAPFSLHFYQQWGGGQPETTVEDDVLGNDTYSSSLAAGLHS